MEQASLECWWRYAQNKDGKEPIKKKKKTKTGKKKRNGQKGFSVFAKGFSVHVKQETF